MVVGEQRNERENGHDLELYLVGLMSDLFRLSVQFEIEHSDADDDDDQRDERYDHQDVGFTRRGDKPRQMV